MAENETTTNALACDAVCATPGCGKLAARLKRTLCYGCYMRQYRKGTVDYHKPAERRPHSGGYVVIRAPSHPLAVARDDSYEYEHRVVFYDRHGDGPFNCHWCGIGVAWATMHVDHKDEDRKNNAPENLVPSCPRCNQWRNAEKTSSATRAATGRMITAFGRTQCLSEWAREIGISHSALATRLSKGWSVERALTEKRGRFGPPSRQILSSS